MGINEIVINKKKKSTKNEEVHQQYRLYLNNQQP